MTERACTVCGGNGWRNGYSWVDHQPVCAGHCYQVAVARVLEARRRPIPVNAPLPAVDRSPMPATEAVTEGDGYFRLPTPRRAGQRARTAPAKPHRGAFVCAYCHDVVTDRPPFRVGAALLCTLSCVEDFGGG
jgi:hypothetical protein